MKEEEGRARRNNPVPPPHSLKPKRAALCEVLVGGANTCVGQGEQGKASRANKESNVAVVLEQAVGEREGERVRERQPIPAAGLTQRSR